MTKTNTKTKVKEKKSTAEKLSEVPTQLDNIEVNENPNTQTNAEITQTDNQATVPRLGRRNKLK